MSVVTAGGLNCSVAASYTQMCSNWRALTTPKYTGLLLMGLDRLVMMKQNIEDVRHFESGKLEF